MLKKRLQWLVLAVLVTLGFCGLGRWQLGRAVEKELAVQQADTVLTKARVTDLARASTSPANALLWVRGQGRYLRTPTLLLDNQRRGDKVGVRVYRIFMPDGGAPVLVDQGWLSVPGNRVLPNVLVPSQAQQLVQGLYTPPPSAGLALGPAFSKPNQHTLLLTRLDMAELRRVLALPLAANIVRLDPSLPSGYARDLNLLSNALSPDKHRGYALQWFGLAAATVIIFLLLMFREMKHV